jgi:hypothetical protein
MQAEQHQLAISQWSQLIHKHGHGMNPHALHCALQFKVMAQLICFTMVMQQLHQKFHLAQPGIKPDPQINHG